jgi:hypothetical protein
MSSKDEIKVIWAERPKDMPTINMKEMQASAGVFSRKRMKRMR